MGKTGDTKLRQLLQKGGEFDPQSYTDVLRAEAAAHSMAWCVADCDRARSVSAVFRAIVKAVDYPQFFGSSFDGLYDCLCDTLLDQKVGVVLLMDKLHTGDPAIATEGVAFMQVMSDTLDFARENDRVFLYGIDHAGKHAEDTPGIVRSWSETGQE